MIGWSYWSFDESRVDLLGLVVVDGDRVTGVYWER